MTTEWRKQEILKEFWQGNILENFRLEEGRRQKDSIKMVLSYLRCEVDGTRFGYFLMAGHSISELLPRCETFPLEVSPSRYETLI
jgi:hypothetical protein